jgi:hypothetical protein
VEDLPLTERSTGPEVEGISTEVQTNMQTPAPTLTGKPEHLTTHLFSVFSPIRGAQLID